MFVDLNYEPSRDDLVCTFYLEPKGISIEEAAESLAGESSIGTWTEVKTLKENIKRLAAKVFSIEGNIVKVAYPSELFEEGNMPQILSGIAGNIFGLKTIENLRLVDVEFPESLVKSFKGPKFGIDGIRKMFKIYDRPLIGTIVKPKVGLSAKEHAEVAYEAWVNGVDIVKDDENLADMKFNRFEERLKETLKAKERAENETGEKKGYLINVTASALKMIERAKLVEEHGNEYIMIDIITSGFSALQALRELDLNLAIHAHRAGHAAFTRKKKHGISMKVVAKISRIIGVDQLHIGTFGVGKMKGSPEEDREYQKALTEELFGIKKVLPVASGGLHPRVVPELIKKAGIDIVVQAGGGIHGHLRGTAGGAKAMRAAVEAAASGISLEEAAKKSEDLRIALEQWK